MDRQARTGRRGETGGERKSLVSHLFVVRFALYALVRFASWAGDGAPRPVVADYGADDAREEENGPAAGEATEPRPRPAAADGAQAPPERGSGAVSRTRRLASSLVFAALFFSGAALSAVAGDVIGSPDAGGQTSTEICEPASAPTEEDAAGDVPAEGCETGETETGEAAEDTESQPDPEEETEMPGESESELPPASDPDAGAEAPDDDPAPAEGEDEPSAGPAPGAPQGGGQKAGAPPLLDVDRPAAPRALDPEAHGEEAVVWLHRILPDPTPSARRLAPAFARDLRRSATRHRISWSLLLAVVRAHGNTGRVPVGARTLDRIAGRLAAEREALGAYRPWHLALRYSGRTAFADRALALDRYNRAVGLRALVAGLAAARPALARRVLADRAIEIYAAGRADVAAGRTDVRVLVLLRYLRIAHGSVTVSSLTSGHRLYARPGVVSAHVYGLAVDIAALGGRSIAGNQGPGGLTERAVRNILLLPAELAPQQVISLLGLGGASFPLADHADHIHVGY